MDTVRPPSPPRRWLACAALAWAGSTGAQDAARPADVEPRFGRVELPSRPMLLARRQGPLFGVASIVLRTEGESERVRSLMHRLLLKAGADGVRIERLRVGAGWRIVGYPFADRAAAERAGVDLLKGGLRTELIEF